MDKIIDRIRLPRLFSWNKQKYFSLVDIMDIYDDTIIFHSKDREGMDSFILELLQHGIRIVQGECRDPRDFSQGEEIGAVCNPITSYERQVGVTQGRMIIYFWVEAESIMEWIK